MVSKNIFAGAAVRASRDLGRFTGLAPDVVNALHHVRIVADAGDFERFLRRDEDGLAGGDARIDVLQRLVVPDVPASNTLPEFGGLWYNGEKQKARKERPS